MIDSLYPIRDLSVKPGSISAVFGPISLHWYDTSLLLPDAIAGFAERLDSRLAAMPQGARIFSLAVPANKINLRRADRERLETVLRQHRLTLHRITAASALVTQSPFVRGAIRAITFFATRPYPFAPVASVKEAFAFFAEHGLTDADRLERTYYSVVAANEAGARGGVRLSA